MIDLLEPSKTDGDVLERKNVHLIYKKFLLDFYWDEGERKRNTAKNTVISPNFLVRKFCENAQFPEIMQKLCLSTKFPHQEIKWHKLLKYPDFALTFYETSYLLLAKIPPDDKNHL